MTKWKCTVAYDGTYFFGYQVQPGKRTVQSIIEATLRQIHKGANVRISASGRTDRGVHAYGQVFHFTSDLRIPEANWSKALNRLLPDDIFIRSVQKVSDSFHARYSVHRKEYRYRLLRSPEPDLFRRLYTVPADPGLDIDRMRQAAQYFLGTHDFSSFCAANTSVKDKTRTIYRLDIEPQGDEIIIRIVGSGFLYQMVRIITGTLLDAGTGRFPPEAAAEIIRAKDRSAASKTVPARGLILWQVFY